PGWSTALLRTRRAEAAPPLAHRLRNSSRRWPRWEVARPSALRLIPRSMQILRSRHSSQRRTPNLAESAAMFGEQRVGPNESSKRCVVTSAIAAGYHRSYCSAGDARRESCMHGSSLDAYIRSLSFGPLSCVLRDGHQRLLDVPTLPS